jgi:hypothetical protein
MIQGILLPRRKSGYETDITFSLNLIASNIIREKKKYV